MYLTQNKSINLLSLTSYRGNLQQKIQFNFEFSYTRLIDQGI